MEPTNDTKMQAKQVAMAVVLLAGIAFAGQWLFNKCFKQEEKVVPQRVANMPDSLRIDTVYNALQKQK